MPLSWNEIKDRALRFSREWVDEASEDAEAKSFWDDFFNVFGVSRRRVANFERRVKKLDGKDGYIDLLWKGVLLIEHKSLGKDLDRAHSQARDYFHGLSDAELPRYLLVSDFARFRLYDLEGEAEPVDFPLKELHKHVRRFGFIAGYQSRTFKEQDPVNVAAAERMGKLHDALKAAGYDGHRLELLLVRILFCVFADDTGIFPRHAFHDFIDQRTSADGADLGLWLGRIFQVLNTPEDARQKTLDELLAELPYVNGKLFEESLPFADFDAKMRALLLDASGLDWSRISPAIFGSMFQSVMDTKARRNLGAHYTSEKNILKLIGPLFLDGLKAELDKAGNQEKALAQLHRKLATLKFLDPACGCGNFLVIAYRELRLLELEVLKRQFATQQSVLVHVSDHVLVDVDQFYGIEIEEFPAQIAQVAMWLMDHQMNLRVAEQFGENVARLPLRKSAAIVHGNALRVDWNDVVPAKELDYILGNPPFVGAKLMTEEQRGDLLSVAGGLKGAGLLDFVTGWYLKAAHYMNGQATRAAFVSTNSISQGEQVGVLWGEMLRIGLHIFFAHRTFQWNNEARGIAAVHCVIIGFARHSGIQKRLFDYESIRGEPHEVPVTNINPYLVDAGDLLLSKRSMPVSCVSEIAFGSMPNDGGNLLLEEEERISLLREEPGAKKWVRPFLGSVEFINGLSRWCLWLVGIPPGELRQLPRVSGRVSAVKNVRLKSKRPTTKELASTPTLFGEIRQPSVSYIAIPKTSSENRAFVPIAFLEPDIIASTELFTISGGSLGELGVLSSTMHMAWLRNVGGRLKSDYRYSAGIVYNNFPWPELPPPQPSPARGGRKACEAAGTASEADGSAIGTEGKASGAGGKLREAIEAAAQGVLDARAQFPEATLADLYDALTMPPMLVKAHATLDKAVDAAYIAAEKAAGRKAPKLGTDAERVAFLFERYQALTSFLPVEKPKKALKPRKEA